MKLSFFDFYYWVKSKKFGFYPTCNPGKDFRAFYKNL